VRGCVVLSPYCVLLHQLPAPYCVARLPAATVAPLPGTCDSPARPLMVGSCCASPSASAALRAATSASFPAPSSTRYSTTYTEAREYRDNMTLLHLLNRASLAEACQACNLNLNLISLCRARSWQSVREQWPWAATEVWGQAHKGRQPGRSRWAASRAWPNLAVAGAWHGRRWEPATRASSGRGIKECREQSDTSSTHALKCGRSRAIPMMAEGPSALIAWHHPHHRPSFAQVLVCACVCVTVWGHAPHTDLVLEARVCMRICVCLCACACAWECEARPTHAPVRGRSQPKPGLLVQAHWMRAPRCCHSRSAPAPRPRPCRARPRLCLRIARGSINTHSGLAQGNEDRGVARLQLGGWGWMHTDRRNTARRAW